MAKIYEKNGRLDLARGLKENMKKADLQTQNIQTILNKYHGQYLTDIAFFCVDGYYYKYNWWSFRYV